MATNTRTEQPSFVGTKRQWSSISLLTIVVLSNAFLLFVVRRWEMTVPLSGQSGKPGAVRGSENCVPAISRKSTEAALLPGLPFGSEPVEAQVGARFLLINSFFERLGGALHAFADIVSLCQHSGFTLVEPNVYQAEIGAIDGYGNDKDKPIVHTLLPFSLYWESKPIRIFHSNYTTLAKYMEVQGVEFLNVGIFIPVDILAFVTFGWPSPRVVVNYNTSKFKSIQGTVDCSKSWQKILPSTLLPTELHDGRVAAGNFIYNHIVCVDQGSNLHAILSSMYSSMPGPRVTIVLHEYRRSGSPATMKWLKEKQPLFSPYSLPSNVGSRINGDLLSFKDQSLGWGAYTTLQFRGGLFFKIAGMTTEEINEESFRLRATALKDCMWNVVKAVNSTLHTRGKLHFSSDFSGGPEVFALPKLNVIKNEAFQEARHILEANLEVDIITPNAKDFLSARLDPIGVLSVVDMKLAIDATHFFYMSLSYKGKMSGSSYISSIAHTRSREGKHSEGIVCQFL